MTTQERLEKLLTAEDGPAALAELGYVPKADADKAAADAVTSTRQQMIDVAEIAQLAQLPLEQTVTMLKDGVAPEQARETIQQLRANNSTKTVVQSTVTALTGDGKHPLLAACEQLTNSK